MPRGVYDRKKAAAKPAEAEPKAEAPKKRGRPAKAKPAEMFNPAFVIADERPTGPRFGVFDDGSVTLKLPDCKGQIAPQEAREFLSFLAKIGVKA